MSLIDDVIKDLQSHMAKAHEALKRELGKLRTGRASASMLDSVRIDYYGTPTPLGQMATVNVPEARLITVKPWDRAQVKVVEKAIRDAGLGLNPQPDGDMIRIPIPALTEERRKELVKVARKHGEESKVAIRHSRHEALKMLKEADDEGEIPADDHDRAVKKVEEVVTEGVKQVDAILAHKEKDIMEV
jgi:ribosome recycling factor